MRLNTRKAALRIFIVAAACGCLLAPGSALAAKPSAWLSVPSHTTAGTYVMIRYQLRNIPSSDGAELQRHISGQPAHRWLNTNALFRNSGSIRWYAMMGGRTVLFRIALFNRHNRFVGATSAAHLVISRNNSGGSTSGGSTGGGTTTTAAAPTISWTAPSTATAGSTLAFSYSTTGVPAGGVIALQQEGSDQTWSTIQTTTNTAGPWGIANMGIGANETFRLAVYSGSKVLATSSPDSVNVWGQVPLQQLLENWVNVGTFTTPSNTFPYVADAGWVNFPGPYTDLQVNAANNDCTSVTFQFIEGDENSQDQNYIQGDTATASIVQQSASPVSSTEPLNTPGAVTAVLVPGQSWSLNLSEVVPGNNSGVTILLNGYATCDSTSAIIDNNSL